MIHTPANEQALLKAIALGDQNAFLSLFYLHFASLGNILTPMARSLALAEEIIQDVFLMLWEDRNELGNVQDVAQYIFSQCRERLFLRLKQLSMQQHWFLKNPEDEQLVLYYRSVLNIGISRLPKTLREVYQLNRLSRLSVNEISAALKISVSEGEQAIYESARQLRIDLSDKLPPVLAIVLTSVLQMENTIPDCD